MHLSEMMKIFTIKLGKKPVLYSQTIGAFFLKTYMRLIIAHISCAGKQGKLSRACLSTITIADQYSFK